MGESNDLTAFDYLGCFLGCKMDLMVPLNVPYLIALGNEKLCNIKFYIKICCMISLWLDSTLLRNLYNVQNNLQSKNAVLSIH